MIEKIKIKRSGTPKSIKPNLSLKTGDFANIDPSTVDIENRGELASAGKITRRTSVFAPVERFDVIYVQDTSLATENGRRDPFRVVRDVFAVQKPFDFQRSIALRDVTS